MKLEHLINPPLMLTGNEIELCPPLDVDAYMQYLSDHKEDYARFHGYASWDELLKAIAEYE